MKTLIMISFFLCSFYGVLIFYMKRNLGIHLILSSIIFVIAANLKINSGTEDILLVGLTPILIMYGLLIFMKKKNLEFTKGYRITMVFIGIINLMLLLQLFFQDLFSLKLFYLNFQVYVGVQIIILIIYKFSEHISENLILRLISIFSFVNSVIGILQYMTGKTLLLFATDRSIAYTEGIVQVNRAVGLVGTSNGAGVLGAILFPILLYACIRKKSNVNLVIFSLNLIFASLTLTRAGLLAILIETIIYLLLPHIKSKKDIALRLLGTGFIIIISLILFKLYFADVYNILFTERGNTASARITQFPLAISLFTQHPFHGIGAGNYVDYVAYYYGIKDIVIHSQWINILVEQGAISFICYIGFNITLFVMMLRKYKNQYIWFPLSLFIGNFVACNANPNQYYEINIFIFYFIASGMTFSVDKVFQIANNLNPVHAQMFKLQKNSYSEHHFSSKSKL